LVKRLDTTRAIAQRIDVETGVELVEDDDLRFEHCYLQCLVALLFAAGEVDVEGSFEKCGVEADFFRPRRACGASRSFVVMPRADERRAA
jgi:hypothetical protein